MKKNIAKQKDNSKKALRTLSYLLILKLIEPQFDSNIDIDNYEFDFSHIIDENVEKHKKKLLEIVRFSNLIKEKDVNLHFNMKFLWDDILSVHPSTKNIFTKDKCFEIKHVTTYKKIIDKLNTFNICDYDIDVLGNAYEEVIKDVMTGKVLGQYFTQPSIKKMMVGLIDQQVHDDGTIESCCDPSMGTGGFLITYLHKIIKKAKDKKIKLDWNNIINEGIYGKEIDSDTYQLAVSNMLISTGHMFHNLDRCDSIRKPITRKFDNILANSPFGIKGLKYDSFDNEVKNDYVPIKTDNAVSLFIQAIIYMLKINGKCAIVLPDGQDLFSKTNKTLVMVREYLLKTCDLKEIIYLPAGIFTYTTIKTCVLYFIKKKEGNDVMQIKTSARKRDYKFKNTYQTSIVGFYDCDPNTNEKKLLIDVPIEKIANNAYSLNYVEYCDDNNNTKYNNNICIKALDEVCNFGIGGTPSRSKKEYYENGTHLWVSVKELNGGYIYDTKEKITDEGVKNSNVKLFKKDTIFFSFKLSIGKTGIAGKPLYTNEAIAGITSKNEKIILNKYIYYYLTMNDFSTIGVGVIGNGSLNKKTLGELKIPMPSLKCQKDIIEYCEQKNKLINKLENDIEHFKMQAQQHMQNISKNTKQCQKNDSNCNSDSNSNIDSNSNNNDNNDDNNDDNNVKMKMQPKKSLKYNKETIDNKTKIVKIVKKVKKPIITKK